MQLNTTKIEPEWFTPNGDDGEPLDCEFRIVALATDQLIPVIAAMDGEQFGVESFAEAFRRGVTQIRNLTDSDGKPIRTAQALLAQRNGYHLTIQVGRRIVDKSFADAETEKKS